MSTPRSVMRIAFTAVEYGALADQMVRLGGAGDGWINLLPGGSDEDRPTRIGFFAQLSGGGIGVQMGTWTPPHRDRSGPGFQRIWIAHLVGRRIASELAGFGAPLGPEWVVEQDHPRRGLVVAIPYDEAPTPILRWTITVMASLSGASPSSRWFADVYLPNEPRDHRR